MGPDDHLQFRFGHLSASASGWGVVFLAFIMAMAIVARGQGWL